MRNSIIKGLCAGLLIALGGAVFVACENRYVGAVLFSVALICICYRGDNLFTGKICYVFDEKNAKYTGLVAGGLLGNIISTFVFGKLMGLAKADLVTAAASICEGKLAQSPWETLLRGVFCGVLIYLAVSIFKEHKTPLAIIVCIPVFILSGWEHSIADMFYLSLGNAPLLKSVCFILIVLLGNSIGGVFLPLLKKCEKK